MKTLPRGAARIAAKNHRAAISKTDSQQIRRAMAMKTQAGAPRGRGWTGTTLPTAERVGLLAQPMLLGLAVQWLISGSSVGLLLFLLQYLGYVTLCNWGHAYSVRHRDDAPTAGSFAVQFGWGVLAPVVLMTIYDPWLAPVSLLLLVPALLLRSVASRLADCRKETLAHSIVANRSGQLGHDGSRMLIFHVLQVFAGAVLLIVLVRGVIVQTPVGTFIPIFFYALLFAQGATRLACPETVSRRSA